MTPEVYEKHETSRKTRNFTENINFTENPRLYMTPEVYEKHETSR